MKQHQVLLQSSFLIFLGVLVFLLFLPAQAQAVLCSTESGWKTTAFTCDIEYKDLGGAGLATCQYKLINNQSKYHTKWINATGICSGSGPFLLQASITVGVAARCRDEGKSKCEVHIKVTDQADNMFEGRLEISEPEDQPVIYDATDQADNMFEGPLEPQPVIYDIDYSPPTVSANNASSSWFSSRDVTLSASDTGGSLLDQAWYGWDLDTWDLDTWDPDTMNTGCTIGFTDGTTLPVSAGSHQLYLCARDVAGNTDIWESKPAQYNVDPIIPTIDSFTVNGISYPTTVSIKGSPSISWVTSDIGGSHLKQIEVWRAWDANGDGVVQSSEWNDSSPSPGLQANPVSIKTIGFDTLDTDDDTYIDSGLPDGTYWYGIHTLDNANNCGTERGYSCGDDSSAPFLIKPYIVYPADKSMYPQYEVAVNAYLVELQDWYLEEVGETFSLAPLQIVRSSFSYIVMRCGESPSQACLDDPSKLEGNWGSFMNKAIHGGVEQWEEHTVALIFSAGGGGYGGGDLYTNYAGFAISGDWVLEQISGVVNKWGIPCSYSDGWQCIGGTPKGTPAHELGHGLGLPHPGEQFSDQTLMEWHGNFPQPGFLQQEIDFLRVSPFFVVNIQGPIKVIISGNVPPTVSVLGTPTGGQASVGCVPAVGGAGCDSSSYRLKTYPSNSVCSEIYTDYELSNPQSITFYTWMCAAAKDLDGNEGVSPNSIEFIVSPTVSVLGTPTGGQASVGCVPAVGVAGCDSSSYRLKTYPSNSVCSEIYTDYELSKGGTTSPQSITSYTWMCAAAKDSDGNEGVSPNSIEFLVVEPGEGPPLGEFTPIPPFINDTTPDFTFNSTEAGTITYGGDCFSSTTVAIAGDNTITLNELSGGIHTNCTITVTDGAGNVSVILNINSFTIDTSIPSILAFDVNPKESDGLWVSVANPNVTINWHVSDDGVNDSGLQEVQVWRSSNGGVDWGQISGSPFAAPSDNWTTSIDDSSAGSGTYLYGIHVVDTAGNEITETEAGFSTISVQVDKDNPIPTISSPQDSTWWREDFTVVFEDVDNDSGLLSCEYEYYDLGSGIGSGVQSRSCGSDTSTIAIGPSPKICSTEGFNLCEVRTEATDEAGNFAESFANFGIDYTAPSVGIPSPGIAQVGIPQIFTTLVSDNVSTLSGCSFFWEEIGSGSSGSAGTSITPDECGVVQDCVVSATHTFLTSGDYSILFGCSDAAQPDPANVGFGGRDVVVESLSVILSADPTAGSINTKFNLFSQVAGSATGNANFKFDCNNGGAWEYEIDDIDLLVSDPGWVMRQGENTKVIAPDIFTVKDLCQYSISDIYTASSLVERGTSSAQDTLLINIGVSDDPEAINLQDNNSSADYCFVSTPPIILSWTFSDVNPGDIQSAYQVQVATNPGFGSPVIDTGKVQSANSEYSPPGLSFAEIYFWRVTVWDSLDNVSPLAEGVAFTTPDHAYPFSDFTWIPTFPLPEEEIQFQDTTIFAPGSFNQSWLWSFGDGTTSTQQNSVHTYNDPSPYVVSLKSSDDVGSCGGQMDLDGDGIPNEIDDDIDGDDILNEDDDDIDGDGISNGQDSSPNGSGGSGESGASIINVALPFPDYQEISPF